VTSADGAGFELSSELTDRDAIGMSTVLGLSLPMLSLLVQCVAETESDWSFVNVMAPSGAWVGVARRSGDQELTVSTNAGDAAEEPYGPELHEVLTAHGYDHVPQHKGYSQQAPFETDDAFLGVARLVAGTLQHAFRADVRDVLTVRLSLEP
jgi:hypothetical protein